jgi:hypothetical protein
MYSYPSADDGSPRPEDSMLLLIPDLPHMTLSIGLAA